MGNDEPQRAKTARKWAYTPKKKLPQSMDAEKGVLGSILLAPQRCMTLAERTIGKNFFYHPSHADIYEALTEMHQDCTPIDLISLTQYLEDTGRLDKVGGPGIRHRDFHIRPTASNYPVLP